MRKVVKTLYRPKHSPEVLVSVRDYEVKECIDKNEAMHIVYGDDVMTLDPESLKTKLFSTSGKIESTLKGGKDYCLMNYIWEPNNYSDDNRS